MSGGLKAAAARLMAAAFVVALFAPAGAQSLLPGQVLSSLAVTPISAPNPVPGADGRVHLAYELLVVNPGTLFITLDKIEIRDEAATAIATLEGAGLAAMTRIYAGGERTVAPGGTAVVFLDVTLAPAAAVPAGLHAAVTISRQLAGADGKPAPFPPGEPVPATVAFDTPPVTVGRPAVVLEPPLRGGGWVAINGCCAPPTAHRAGIIPVNGRISAPERFAIDWVQIDAQRRLFTGDPAVMASYPYYGVPVHAVADGRVVNLYDSANDEVPGKARTDLTPESIGGNMIVLDIGGGDFAFYAHLKRGSLRVKLGDTVKTGDELALLGNTGNSDAPHLHFHVMDGPSPLAANGLPFVFRRFTSAGTIPDAGLDALMGGAASALEPALSGPHTDAMPLNNQVVAFD